MTQAAYRRISASGEDNWDIKGDQSLRTSRFDALSMDSTRSSKLSNATSLPS